MSGWAVEVCDPSGLLREAGPCVLRLPRAEWPRWKPSMPLSWMLPAHSGAGSYAGRAIAIAVLPLNDLFVLQARRLDPLDDLSPRERDVANGLLEGLSY